MIVTRSVKTIYHSLDKLKADIVQKFVEKVSKSMEKINKLEWTISLQQTAIDDLKIKCGGNKQYSVCVCVWLRPSDDECRVGHSTMTS